MIPQLLLFAATFVTTLFAGAALSLGIMPDRLGVLVQMLAKNPLDIFLGLPFSIPLLSILSVHEMGHYTAARRHGVAVTLPYFIPAPPFVGTFGAFIKLRSPVPNRNALLDIGAAGPIAGAAVAIPVLLVGLGFSSVVPVTGAEGFSVGGSLLVQAAAHAVLGDIPQGYTIALHPVAFAGWIGLLVTALNLLPSGQLDGGHIAYALFGDRYAKVARVIPYLLVLLGLLWLGWIIWAALRFILGTRHPAPVFAEVPVSRGRRLVGLASGVLFLLCFTPSPVPM